MVSYKYDTWGQLLSIEGNLASTVGEKNPYRYRGYRYDSETGLYYLQSRYYNPDWGRFVNADSYGGKIGNLLSHNVFAYCGNNPVTYADPSGQWFETALDIAAVAISTVAFISNPSWSSLGFLAWDLGAAALPFVPGSYVGKGLKAASKIEEVGGATKTVAKAGSAATKGTSNVASGLRTVEEAGISASDARRIQNAANRTNQEITVVGSRANGTASSTSDWDYILSGNSAQRHSARSSLPRGTAGGEINSMGRETGIDIFTNYPNAPSYLRIQLDPIKPHVIFTPKR